VEILKAMIAGVVVGFALAEALVVLGVLFSSGGNEELGDSVVYMAATGIVVGGAVGLGWGAVRHARRGGWRA